MTDGRGMKQHKLAYEILALIGISAFFALLLFFILSLSAGAVVQSYCYNKDLVLTELEWLEIDRWVFRFSAIFSLLGFSLLFLALFSDRITYIRTITNGIDALRTGQVTDPLPLVGKNELTQLSGAINEMSAAHQRLREKELALLQEKEQFLRILSHDIRTPLTSVLGYAEYLAGENDLSPEVQRMHLQTIRKKALQIRDLTALLLDADQRNPEHFDNARLLMEQLAAEFEEDLEERFPVHTDLSGCSAFAGTFDVQELRRIFDNLSSNVHKYADPTQTVLLRICTENGSLCIRQENRIPAESGQKDSYKLGIHSIRRIAQNYGGTVSVQQDADFFAITVTFFDF